MRQARSEARIVAKIEVRKMNPFHWLRYGPGRERSGEPGWTDSIEVQQQPVTLIITDGGKV